MRFRRTEHHFIVDFCFCLFNGRERSTINPHVSQRTRDMGHPPAARPVDSPYYSYYFRATSMALLCLVRLMARCYCADRDVLGSSPVGSNEVDPDWGVFYAEDEPVLRGNWLCGGSLDFQAASRGRPSDTVSVAGSSVDSLPGLGRAPRCASLRQRAPIALFLLFHPP
jgi:hypothetical protein